MNEPTYGEESFTVLHFASFNGNLEMLKYAMSQGGKLAKVHRNSKSGISLFHAAA